MKMITRALVIAAIFALISCKETTQAESAPETSSTKKDGPQAAASPVEDDLSKTGIIVVMGLSEIGAVKESTHSISLQARELYSTSNPASRRYGIRFDIADSFSRNSTSAFVADSEIEPLIAGIDAIAKLDKSVTGLDEFQASYKNE